MTGVHARKLLLTSSYKGATWSMDNEKRNDEIEVLRALSILLVVFSHLGFLFHWRHFPIYDWISERFTFWIGVDLFFCISGFVIARSLISRLEGMSGARFWSEVVAFWIRRWYRIIPSAWCWLIIILVLTACFNQTFIFGHLQSNLIHALSAFLNIANFHFHSCLVASGNGCEGNVLSVYWSLSLEEQFYFALPILFGLSKKWFAPACIFFVAIQFFIPRDSSSSLLWFLRTDAIFLGVLLALAQRSKIYFLFEPTVLRHLLMRWFIFLLLCFSLGAVPANGLVPFSVGFVALICVSMVFIASFDSGLLMKAGALRTLLVWIGSRSYAIYLIHWPAFLIIRECWNRLHPFPPADDAVAIAFHATGLFLMLGLSELNFRLIETPFRRKGRQIANAYLKKNSGETAL